MTDPADYIRDIFPRVEAYADAVAHHEFATMLNPKYRGPKWDWERFVPHAVKWAETSVWQSFTDGEWKAWEKDITRDVRRISKAVAERLLEESGLLEWWPAYETQRALLDEAFTAITDGQVNADWEGWCARVVRVLETIKVAP